MYLHGVHGTTQLLMTILLITDSTVCVVRNLERTDNFRFSECSWDGNTCAEINDVNWEPGDMVSDWPAGPYALPMSVDGCPESKWKGWEQGYIDLTWENPYAVLNRNVSTSDDVNDNDTTVDLEDITLAQITDIQSLIKGPYNRYRIKLNFCFKLRNDPILDIGEWPNGSYGIYGDITGCPTGFSVDDKIIKLPKSSFWISDGYLPFFHSERTEDNEELSIRICTRSLEWSEDSGNISLPSKEPFILLNGNEESTVKCSANEKMILTGVMLYLQSVLPGPHNNTALTSLLAVCYYWPVQWSDEFNEMTGATFQVPFYEDSFVYTNVYISRGNVLADSFSFPSRSKETVYSRVKGLSGFLAHSTKAQTSIEWTVLDLGKTFPVTAVFVPHEIDMKTFTGVTSMHGQDDKYCLKWTDVVNHAWGDDYTFPDESVRDAGRNCRYPVGPFLASRLFCMTDFNSRELCEVFHWWREGEGFPRCFISNGKWDFLHFSALTCSYKVYYDFSTTPAGYYMRFNKVMEGRFVVLIEDNSMTTDKKLPTGNAQIKVLITDHIFGHFAGNNFPCNSDMGMTDLNIEDYDITSSSTLADLLATFARPFLAGWCAEIDDTSPFIMVRLHRTVRLDGLTVWNWEGTSVTVVNGSIQKQFFKMGARAFEISFGLTEDNLTVYSGFQVDLLYHVDEPQHFRFYRPVYARVAKIHTLEPLYQNMRCLRFELHGCRKTGVKNLQCTKSDLETLNRYSGLVMAEIQSTNTLQNTSFEDCERACLHNKECTSVHVSSNGDCLLFKKTDNQLWHLQSKDSVAGHTAAKTCESDYIQTPNIFYNPSNERFVHGDHTVSRHKIVSYISVIKNERIISSIGYPLHYGHGESYKWVIKYEEYEFIRFVITNVSLNTYEPGADQMQCDDTIIFDEERQVFSTHDWKRFTIDSSYNGRIFVIDSRVYQLTLTFTSCQYYTAASHRGRGFRAIVQKQDVPTCFTVNDFSPLSDKHVENCDMLVMYLTSMAYNNIPFNGLTETWNISHKTGTLRLEMLYFDVKCDGGSEFILADRFMDSRKYCTLNRPPGIIYTASGSVGVTFSKANALSVESFRLLYRAVKDVYPETITVRASSVPDIIGSMELEARFTQDSSLNSILLQYEHGRIMSFKDSINVPRFLHKACSRHFNKCYMIYSHFNTWDIAGDECWIRHQRLVVIRSFEELKLVKYLLRTLKMIEQYPQMFETSFVHNRTIFYYAYIGLRRYRDNKGKVYEMWENKTPVTFSAWKKGEPLNGDCTRMGFHLGSEDMTWEATECSKLSKAFYFVCEHDIGNRSIDIKDRVHVIDYKGTQNTTVKGLTCQRWDQQYPHQHIFSRDSFFPDNTVADAANYCRAPRGPRLYCYTTDPYVKTDFCYANELQEERSPVTYSGHLDVTSIGQKCSKWEQGVSFFNGTLTEASNYCRVIYPVNFNDETSSYLLCELDNNGRNIYATCAFKDTESDRCFETHYTYSGVQNSTVSGTVCIRWEMHFSQNNFDQFAFPDKDLVEAGNHCRDPTSSGFQWCYTTYPGKSWEICKADYGKIIHDKHDNSSANVKPTLKCNHGSNEHSYASCNRIVDCDDISDELDCHSQLHPLLKTASFVESTGRIPNVDPGSTFLCGSLEWISSLARCDGIIDCKDVSDETNCSRTTSTEGGCGTNQFTCSNGVCIHVSLVCNFVSDCADSSDEICDFPDCGEDEYTCESGQCIPSYQRCDAFHNCWDGTDENNCQSCSSPAVFNCDFVRCLPWRIVCDGYPDCEDNSDESSCDTSDVTSCKEWWEAGYRETGKYIISSELSVEIAVICDFSSVTSMGIIYTIFHQVDIIEWEGNMVFYTRFVEYDNRYVPYDDIFDFLFASTDDTANFTQEIVQSCAPPLDAASEVDDIRYNHTYLYCRCLNITIGIGWEPTINSVRDCGTGGLLTEDERDSILFDYIYTANHRAQSWKNSDIPSDSLRLQIGPVVFAEEYFTDASTFGCGEARNVFNMSLLCVYDTDQTGTIIGCRSGSHLQNCKYHECPEGTVKCPDSYCIPLRFVCDGVEQCPNSEDEFQCGCSDTEREVIILHEDSEFRGPDLIKVARQLYSTNGIVRSVKYKSNKISQGIPFEHRILHISDKEIKPFELNDRDYTCEYKVLANDFMNVIQFSRKTSHSLLFIQNSPESAVVASLIFSNITNMPDFTVYRIMEGVNTAKGQFPYVKDVYVENWNVMSTLAARYLPKLCKEATMTHCPGAYKCAYSKMCVQLSEICDGYRHCIHGDDEFLCDFTCPVECVCSGFTVSCGDSGFNVTDVRGFPVWTRSLELTDSAIDIPLSETLFDFPFLYLLNLSSSGTERIEENAFIRLSNLRILDISNNKLTALSENVFAGLQNLHTLNLDGNSEISFLGPFTFKQLVAIRVLRITGTKLRTVMSNTFSGLSLEILDLRDNDIQEIEEFGLGNLEVNHIRFQENDITSFHKGVFTGVLALKSLQTPAYKFCCIRPNYVSEDKCFPQKDEFSSCEDLMRISALQTMLWLIGLCALIGNILSVIYRLIFDRQRLRLGYGIFVTNLAVADFLMGIYLLTIAVADAVFRKRYIFMDDYWRNSSWCTFAGVLSTLSSEASVMFLCLITLDRLLVIKYPFGQVRFDTRKASMISVLAWITSLFIALFPLMLTGYFQNRFYNKSGVCIALPLTRDRPPGWLYSVLVFIGLNFATFLLIAAGQWSIYMEIRKSSSKLRKSQSRKKDLIIARNLLLVVATDFLCWFPIGCMGVMAMSGYVISGDVYAWAAVFILPVNSALNPVLYTLTAIIGKKSFTPNTDEQKRNTTNTGIGKRFLVSQHIMTRRFYLIDSSVYVSYITVQECFQKFDHIPFQAILKMSYQLTECLRVLHKNGLVLRRIDEYSIYVNTNQAKVVGDIQIRHEPTLCIKISEKREDVYSLGLLIKELVVKSFK